MVVFNKPYGVICQFTSGTAGEPTLADYIAQDNVYPAGRLDKDSEGMVLLTDSGALQSRISQPEHKMTKHYWVQVEGEISEEAISTLRDGVVIAAGKGQTWTTKPAKVKRLDNAPLSERNPPIRQRKNIPTSWIEITLQEGKNRQVRRMTAATGFPCLRLFRHRIGLWQIDQLKPGEYRTETVNLPNP